MGATLRRARCMASNASRGSTPSGSVNTSSLITSATRENRSVSTQSDSVTIPIGTPSASTTAAPWARLWISDSAAPMVSSGPSRTGVSYTGWRAFTQAITSATTSTGMSCGMITSPPRRATVSAMRRPATAVMLATTIGIVAPDPSGAVRSTENREATAERVGTRNASS